MEESLVVPRDILENLRLTGDGDGIVELKSNSCACSDTSVEGDGEN